MFLLRQKKLEVAMEEEGLADEEVMLAVITVTVVNNLCYVLENCKEGGSSVFSP